MTLEMRSRCERCQSVLGQSSSAFICSYECTFCPVCAGEAQNVCPNCGGELVARPKRSPQNEG